MRRTHHKKLLVHGNPFSLILGLILVFGIGIGLTAALGSMSSNPVLYWKFDEGTGSTVNDAANNGYSGLLGIGASAPSWDSSNRIGNGYSLKFSGTNQYVSRSYSADTKLNPGTNDFSVSLYFLHPSAAPSSGTHTLISRYNGAGYKLYMNTGGNICFGIDDDASWGPDDVTCSPASYADNKWHFAEAVKNSTSSIILYIDGQQVSTLASLTALNSLSGSSPSLYVGIDSAGNSNSWSGWIDNVKIYGVAQNANQVKGNYNAKNSLREINVRLGGHGAAENLSNGLVGYWKLDEISAGTGPVNRLDSSGNNNTLTDNNTTPSVSGKFGNGANITYANAENLLISNANQKGLGLTGPMSACAWFKHNTDANVNDILGKFNISANQKSYRLSTYGTNMLYFVVSPDGTNSYDTHASSNSFSDGVWNHVCGIYTGTQLQLYINGVLYSGANSPTSYSSGIFNSSAEFTISDYNNGEYWNGSLDDVRIYNRALSPSEVSALYEWAPGPVAYYNFEEGSGNRVYDQSGNGLNGTRGGISQNYVPGKFGSAGNFDGSNDAVTVPDNNSLDITGAVTLEGWVYDPPRSPVVSSEGDPLTAKTSGKVGPLGNATSIKGNHPENKSKLPPPRPEEISCLNNEHEIISQRTATSKLFVKEENGQTVYNIESSIGQIHYKDNPADISEPWKDINTTLIADEKPLSCGAKNKDFYDIKMEKAPYHVYFKNNFQENNIVKLHNGSESVFIKPGSLYLGKKLVSPPKNAGAQTSGSEILWKNAYGDGLDFKWQADNMQLFKRLIVNSLDKLPIPEKNTDNLTLNLAFELSPDLKVEHKGKGIQFTKNGQVLWEFMELKAWDKNNKSISMNFDSYQKDGKLSLAIHLPYSWISQAAFPIFVDTDLTEMTISVNGDNTGQWWTGGIAWNTYNTHETGSGTGEAYLGYYDSHRYWNAYRFTLPAAIPSNATITSAALKLYGWGTWQWDNTTAPQDYLRLYVADAADPGQTTTDTARPVPDSGTTAIYPSTLSSGIKWPASGGLTWNTGYNTSVDFSSNIQYLVNTYSGLAQNAHVQVWVTEDTPQVPTGGFANSELNVYFAEKGSSYYPKLNISYSSALPKILMGKGKDAYHLDIDDSLNVTGYINTSNTVTSQITKAFHHLAMTYDGTTQNLYVDGVLKDSKSVTGAIGTNTTDFKIGQSINGKFDEVKIYNYARTPKQIISDMNTGHPAVGSPDGSALIHWKFNELSGSIANNSGNGGSALNGTISNGTWSYSGKYDAALVLTSTSSVTAAIINPQYSHTLSFWLYPTNGINSKTLVTAGKLTTDSSSRPVYGGCTGTALDLNQWTHLVAVSDGSGQCRLYQNGKLTSSGNTGVTFGTTINIGANSFSGTIDDFKFYNYPLNDDDIKLDYNRGASVQLGNLSANTGNTTPGTSTLQKYCIPGDPTSCNGPDAEWNFDENNGNVVHDSNNGSYNGTWQGTVSSVWATGKNGSAGKFNGSNNRVAITPVLYLSPPHTVELWLSWQSSVDGVIAGYTSGSYAPYIDGTNIYYSTQLGEYVTVAHGGLTSAWTHFAIVRNNTTTVTFYKNGVQLGNPQTIPVNRQMIIDSLGAYDNGTYPFQGLLDNVRFFAYDRSPSQIAWDYNQGKPQWYLKLDQSAGTTAGDSGPQKKSGTLQGNAFFDTTVGNCKYGYCVGLNGNGDYLSTSAFSPLASAASTTVNASWGGWYYLNNGTKANKVLFEKATELRISTNASGQPLCEIYTGGSFASPATPPAALSENTWNQVICTYDGANVKTYINGNLADSETQTGLITAASSFAYLGSSSVPGSFLSGRIDDQYIFNYPLTPSLIKILYNNNSAVSF